MTRRLGRSAAARPAASPRSRSPIIELVGPAGAGKTAVLRALRRRDPAFRAGVSIDRLRFAPVMARHALALAPMSVELLWRRPRAVWPSLLHLLRLRTFPAVLAREARRGHRAIILDEGPVFSLTRLSVFQDAARATGRLEREWRRSLARCSECLDAVVWLDAEDPILIQRIRGRPKSHRVKREPDANVSRFLDRYRAAFHDVLDAIQKPGRARMVKIDTAYRTAEGVADEIVAALSDLSSLSAARRG